MYIYIRTYIYTYIKSLESHFYGLQVGNYDEGTCYASDIGFPGDRSYQLVNLGCPLV